MAHKHTLKFVKRHRDIDRLIFVCTGCWQMFLGKWEYN